MPPPTDSAQTAITPMKLKKPIFDKETAEWLDFLYQAQIYTLALELFVSQLQETGALGDATFSAAQAMLYAFFCFKPGSSKTVKVVHIVLCIYALTNTAYALFLFFFNVNCIASKETYCNIQKGIQVFGNAYRLAAAMASKIIKSNERKLSGMQQGGSVDPSLDPTSPFNTRSSLSVKKEPLHARLDSSLARTTPPDTNPYDLELPPHIQERFKAPLPQKNRFGLPRAVSFESTDGTNTPPKPRPFTFFPSAFSAQHRSLDDLEDEEVIYIDMDDEIKSNRSNSPPV
ncbi:MAG: hypothetical protein NTW08_02195 [Gammaproteobacteria bacterium]|nr:hypothetical protein [Gammaproteobacteria bacterium]